MNLFFCDPITATVASLVSAEVIRSSVDSQYYTTGLETGFESRDFIAYCILSDYLHGSDEYPQEVITELRKQYPEKAEEAQISHFEYVNDL